MKSLVGQYLFQGWLYVIRESDGTIVSKFWYPKYPGINSVAGYLVRSEPDKGQTRNSFRQCRDRNRDSSIAGNEIT